MLILSLSLFLTTNYVTVSLCISSLSHLPSLSLLVPLSLHLLLLSPSLFQLSKLLLFFNLFVFHSLLITLSLSLFPLSFSFSLSLSLSLSLSFLLFNVLSFALLSTPQMLKQNQTIVR